jgi:hypothetical protein
MIASLFHLNELERLAAGTLDHHRHRHSLPLEAAFHLQSVSTVLAMVRDGLVGVAFDCREHWPQLEGLATRYADRHPDLADLCLVRLSELHPPHSVVTIDRADFKVYRRNKRETIPILCPPEK